jgi:hypothetical protein
MEQCASRCQKQSRDRRRIRWPAIDRNHGSFSDREITSGVNIPSHFQTSTGVNAFEPKRFDSHQRTEHLGSIRRVVTGTRHTNTGAKADPYWQNPILRGKKDPPPIVHVIDRITGPQRGPEQGNIDHMSRTIRRELSPLFTLRLLA